MSSLPGVLLGSLLLAVALFAHAQDVGSTSPQPSPAPASSPVHDAVSRTPDSVHLEILKAPKADYPPQAVKKQLQGQVWLKLFIAETGDVESTEIISGDPLLAEAAERAAKKWKFKPFIKNGMPVKVSTKMPFDFAFEKNVAILTPSEGTTAAAASSVPAAAASADPGPSENATPTRIRVALGVTLGNLVRRVDPVYPLEAKQNHVQGDVLLRAVIGKDGRVDDLKVVSGPPELTEAAFGAVQQWRYRPFLLNGKPVEVETVIKIQFHM